MKPTFKASSTLRNLSQRSLLAASVTALMLVPAYARALTPISEDELAASTGEGIALLPENFSMRFNGEDNSLDNGYIRLIPVGPVSTSAAAKGYKRGDIYLYGFDLSQSSKNYGVGRVTADWGSAFGRVIDSWGTADNPWIIKASSASVPNFAGTSKTVSYLMIEAPFYKSTLPAAGTAESSAYNLKLNMWLDAFTRDGAVAETLGATSGLTDRIRLRAAWDGFGVNGSNIRIFQTLDGVTAANVGQGLNTSYNNTFGMSGLLRLNSGDTRNLKATLAYGAPTISTIVNPATPAAGAVTITYNPPNIGGFSNNVCGSSTNNAGKAAGGDNPGHCVTQEGYMNVTASASGTNSWTPPSFGSVLRLSTQETANTAYLASPALGGASPSFSNTDGIFIYGLNANLVLGSLSQPLILDSNDGSNFTVELTRIPNNANVYKQIYTDYTGVDATYKGSTCNIFKCGTAVTLGGVGYQGSDATHSSITIGTTNYNATDNTLTAYNGVEAVGISFGELVSTAGLSSTANATYQQAYQRSRTCTTNWLGNCDGGWNGWGAWSKIPQTQFAQNTNGQILRVVSNVPGSNPLTVPGKSVSNNFGSAVIDGLLIQHLKITTTGLN